MSSYRGPFSELSDSDKADILSFTEREEHPYPKPDRSFVLAQLLEGESYLFNEHGRKNHGREFGELYSEGGSADIEQEAGMLDYAVAEMLVADGKTAVGWWVIEGFYGNFTKDYYGEVDCDYECDLIRRARWSDLARFETLSWWRRALMKLGFDGEL